VQQGEQFEEALEVLIKVVLNRPTSAAEIRNFRVEMVIDRSSSSEANPVPSPDAMVKQVDCGTDTRSLIQNVPSGRTFLVAVVATLGDGSRLRSTWARFMTLPLSKALGADACDGAGNLRGECFNCPCKGFRRRPDGHQANSKPSAVLCRGCGCHFSAHKLLDSDDSSDETHVSTPPELELMDANHMAAEGRQAGAPEAELGQMEFAYSNSVWANHAMDSLGELIIQQSDGRVQPWDMLKKLHARSAGTPACRRVSIACPTTEARQGFHQQIWDVFNAQMWPDKELIVVETYKDHSSPFFNAKSTKDARIVYVPLKIESARADFSIGLKRNLCTYLASGEVIANFDDDDLYAPSYLGRMLKSMVEQQSHAITLGSWYVCEISSGRCGYVDPQQGTLGIAPIDKALYGYGFSYVYSREAALDCPYPNSSFGEDYDFFNGLREGSTLSGSKSWKVALYFDRDGICLHMLHSASASSTPVQRELPREEIQYLDVVKLGSILNPYLDERCSLMSQWALLSHVPMSVRAVPCLQGL